METLMRRVLNVGQCGPDHSSISRMLTQHFEVSIDRADSADETYEMMREQAYDLVLINRKLDADYSDGSTILKRIKSDAALSSTPVMIVSNFEDAQEAAVRAGAERGFGKAELNAPDVIERLGIVLGNAS